MHISALTQGENTPSARFRIRQLIEPLGYANKKITELTCTPGAYPPPGRSPRIIWAYKTVIDSFFRTLKTHQFDASILQRELISTIPSFEFAIKSPLILDVDDAIWLHRKGIAANNAGMRANHIVAGNSFIAEYFSRFNKTVSIIPTAVDTKRFHPIPTERTASTGIIGWSGTSGGYKFFSDEMLAEIANVLKRNAGWKLQVISNSPPPFSSLPSNQLEYIPWSPENEATLTSKFDIGLMPIFNDDWSRGKCSYKMLLYMSCGIPVVASDIGMNAELLREGSIGFGAIKPKDWSRSIEDLIYDPEERIRLGAIGRELVGRNYSIEVAARKWDSVLSSIGRG
ncbi:glycosyltransferase family 4 protein [Leptothrix sp. BB-4]